MTNAQKLRDLQRRSVLIQKVLGLDEWYITIKLVAPKELDISSDAAETWCNAKYLRAEIVLNSEQLALHPKDFWYETLWHEHLHVFNSTIDELLSRWAGGVHISTAEEAERRAVISNTIEPVVERLGRVMHKYIKIKE